MIISREHYREPPVLKILTRRERFSWYPVQVDDGRWVWLETVISFNEGFSGDPAKLGHFYQTKKF